MSNVYHPLSVARKDPNLPIALSQEAHVWSSTRKLASHDFPHPVSNISFSPAYPHDLAVAYGSAISLISQKAGSVRKTFTKFRDIVYSPQFKRDGRLLVAGCNDQVVKLFDVKSRTPLRTFSGHKGSVRTTKFTTDGLHVFSGSDDATVRVWDVAEGKNIITLNDATDYVRAQNSSPASRHVWVTGSFDNKARLYDIRARKCIFTLNHGSHIDEVHILAGGALVLTAGGPDVRLWDLFSGGTAINSLSCHAKAVTSVAVDDTNKRLMTGGLDGYVKVHDLLTFSTKGVMSLGAPIVSLDLSPDHRSFGVGLFDGAVQIRVAKYAPAESFNEARILANAAAVDDDDDMMGWGRGFRDIEDNRRGPRPGTEQYFNRGPSVRAGKDDVVVNKPGRKNLSAIDKDLKKFEHRNALLSAMKLGVDHTLGVVEELMSRGCLPSTLSHLDRDELCELLKIIKKNISSAEYSKKLVLLLDVILDIHAADNCSDEKVLNMLKGIRTNVGREMRVCDELSVLGGGAEMLMNA